MIGVIKYNFEGPKSKAGMDRVSRFGFLTIYYIRRTADILSQRLNQPFK